MISRLNRADEPELRALLATDPATYLFPLALLEEHGIASGHVVFHGLRAGGVLLAVVAIFGRARQAVPIGGDPAEQRELGGALRGRIHGAIGKRELVDALWGAAGDRQPWLQHAHRTYRITAEEMGPWIAPLRPATARDLPVLARNAAEMQLEDFGRPPADPAALRERVASRVAAGRYFVLEDAGEIVFQVALGSVCSGGGVIEGVYTPPVYRGLGFASQGLGQLCRTQLARLPRLTLTVAEANREAVALYRKLGFLPGAAFRMIRAD